MIHTKNIAGVSNETKNVMGMMPHPERAVDPLLGNTDVALFESLLDLPTHNFILFIYPNLLLISFLVSY